MLSIVIPNFARKELTRTQFQRRCDRLLSQKLVRFTEEEKKDIQTISKNPDLADASKKLEVFFKIKLEEINDRVNAIYNFGWQLPRGKTTPCIKKNPRITPEKAIAIDNKIKIYREKVFKFFNNFIYKPSSNPEVIRIEKELRKKGIKAKFSNNVSVDFAKLTAETIHDIKKRGYQLSPKICDTPFLGFLTNAGVFIGAEKPADTIFFNSTFASKTLDSIKSNQKSEYSTHFKSTDNPKHTIIHEIGHWLHSRMNLKEFFIQDICACSLVQANKPALSKNNIELLKNSVSGYSISNSKLGLEAVAEIFTGLIDGKKYGQRIMNIYKRLKGPIPKSN